MAVSYRVWLDGILPQVDFDDARSRLGQRVPSVASAIDALTPERLPFEMPLVLTQEQALRLTSYLGQIGFEGRLEPVTDSAASMAPRAQSSADTSIRSVWWPVEFWWQALFGQPGARSAGVSGRDAFSAAVFVMFLAGILELPGVSSLVPLSPSGPQVLMSVAGQTFVGVLVFYLFVRFLYPFFSGQKFSGQFGHLLLAWSAPHPLRVVPILGHFVAAIWGAALVADEMAASGGRAGSIFVFLLLWVCYAMFEILGMILLASFSTMSL